MIVSRRLIQEPVTVVAGWTDANGIVLVYRDREGRPLTQRRRSRFSFFLQGADDDDRRALARDRGVEGVSVDAVGWTRVDCVNKWARRDLLRVLEQRRIPTYEGDVGPLRRLLTDDPSISISDRFETCWLDLEVDSRASFKDQRAGKARILSWSVGSVPRDNPLGDPVLVTRVLENDSDEAERALLATLFDTIATFDVVLAWAGTWGDETYDFCVLRERIVRLALRWRGGEPPWHRWNWLDHLDVFRKYNQAHESGEERASLKLDDVAHNLLGTGKVKFDSSRVWEAWLAGQDSRAELARYNAMDVELCVRIEQRTGFVQLHLAVCRVCRCFPDNHSLRATEQGDGFLLALGAQHQHRWPTRQRDRDEVDPYEGAFVMEPRRLGAIDNVHVADFAGLYPSIIRSWNLSPETALQVQDEVRPGVWEPVNQDVPRCRSVTGGRYRLDRRGMFPLALDTLVAERKRYSAAQAAAPVGSEDHEHYKRLSAAFKIVANSFYGIIGSPFSRYYNPSVATAVTQAGAWLIRHVMSESSRRGCEPFYGDSIVGDRPAVMLTPAGDVWIRPFEQLWSAAVDITAVGDKEVGRLPGWATLAKRSDGEGWFPVERIIRHRVTKRVVSIATKRGQTEVTADHSLMVAGERVTPHDFLDRGLEFDTVGALPAAPLVLLDLFDYVAGFSVSWPYKGRVITRRFRIDPTDSSRLKLAGWGSDPIRIQRFYEVGSPSLRALIRVCAAYASDGSASLRPVTSSQFSWSVCKQNADMLSRVMVDVGQFTTGVRLTGPTWSKGAGVFTIRSGTAAMSMLFAALCGFKSRGKRLPDFLFRLPKSEFGVFSDQMVLGDSARVGEQVRHGTTSPVLAAQLSYLLDLHGIEHAHSYRADKKFWGLRTRPPGMERARRTVKSSQRMVNDQYVYDLEVAGAHTFVDGVGRVLLHNTDSVFVTGSAETFTALVADLNERWGTILEAEFGVPVETCSVKLEFEKTFRRIVLVSAKRYAGTFAMYKGKAARADAKPEVKGLEYKRGDTVRLSRTMQRELISLLLRPDLPEPAELHAWAAEWRRRVLEDPIEVDDIVLSQSVNALSTYVERWSTTTCRTPVATGQFVAGKRAGKKAVCGHEFREPDGKESAYVTDRSPTECPVCKTQRKRVKQPVHVRIAKLLASRGQAVGEGTRVRYVFVGAEGDDDNAIPVDDLDDIGRIDRSLYWTNRIYPASQRVLEAVYPRESWAAEGKVKTERVDDLPLFGAPPKKMRRRLVPKPEPLFDRLGPPVVKLTIEVSDRDATEALKTAVGETIAFVKAHPGESKVELTLKVTGGPSRTVVLERTVDATAAKKESLPPGVNFAAAG